MLKCKVTLKDFKSFALKNYSNDLYTTFSVVKLKVKCAQLVCPTSSEELLLPGTSWSSGEMVVCSPGASCDLVVWCPDVRGASWSSEVFVVSSIKVLGASCFSEDLMALFLEVPGASWSFEEPKFLEVPGASWSLEDPKFLEVPGVSWSFEDPRLLDVPGVSWSSKDLVL